MVLGATAGKALLGSSFRVTQVRGTVLEEEIHGGFLSDPKGAARVLA